MLSKIGKADAIEFARRYCSGIKGFNEDVFIQESTNLKRTIRGTDSPTPEHQKLFDTWYKSLANGDPDYTVYDQLAILQDIWACWSLYSRSHIKSLITRKCGSKQILEKLGKISSVLDIGNGIGYTTAALKQVFPHANVIGYNIEYSFQYPICQQVADEFDFKMIGSIDSIDNVDLLFASEYFEHYERPIEHLQEVLEATHPKNIVIANSFGTEAIGHFINYKNKDSVLSPKQIRKQFNDVLKANNYNKLDTNCWNDRPIIWKRNLQTNLLT